jgi:hypothetical protein
MAARVARENSLRAKYANKPVSQNLPTEDYQTIGGTEICSHGVNIPKHPEHNCREFENAKRAARGAPPLE